MKQIIFVKDTKGTPAKVGNSVDTTYLYNPEKRVLKVFWKRGGPVVLENVSEGEPVWVNCWGGIPQIGHAKLPNGKIDCLAWLLGFPKATRVRHRKNYRDLLIRQRYSYRWDHYEEYVRYDNGWSLVLCNRPDCDGVRYVACYISKYAANNKDIVKDIFKAWSELRGLPRPKAFVQATLRERFDFSEADLQDLEGYLGD